MKIRLSILITLIASLRLFGQTSFNAGDLAIIGYDFDGSDDVAFVVLTDVEAGTEVSFTDNGWLSSGGFRTGEGSFTYSFAGAASAGDIFSFSNSLSLAGSGDQIIAYQGSLGSPSLVYGLNSSGSGWNGDADSSNTSALPTGLIDGSTAFAIQHSDNGIFDTSTLVSGTKSEWLSVIADQDNWFVSNDSGFAMPSGTLSVSAIPEASTYALFAGLLAFGYVVRIRKKSCI